MRQKSGPAEELAAQVIKNIRRATRRQFSAEEKIRIVLDGLRGEDSIAGLCRREGIVQNLYYRWSKDFLDAGKKRLEGDTARATTSDEVKELRREASALKGVVAELTLENRLLKKARSGMGKTKNEIPRIREARNHPPRRAVASAGAPDIGKARHTRATFYRRYDLYRDLGPEALDGRSQRPGDAYRVL
jgi:transposase